MSEADTADTFDLLVIGGGVMGLFTAYHASAGARRVAVLERGRVGDPRTASFGRTRSYRKDYLDPLYVRLADEAIGLWAEFERVTGSRALVRCGCLNIAAESITPDLADTYAQRSADTAAALGVPAQELDADGLAAQFPQLRADVGFLDASAGLVDLRAVTAALQSTLHERKVEVHEQLTVTGIERDGALMRVDTDAGRFTARSLVITAGHGTNDLLAMLPGTALHVPITKDRPSEAKYYTPSTALRSRYTSDVFPVVAYLDTGIYLHPIVEGVVDAVKVGYYNPPDIPRGRTGIDNVADFVARCLPELAEAGAATVADVADVDACDYDLVADDDFVLGPVPGFDNVFVGVGWRGTGYKFAPWVGRLLHQLAGQGGSIYDISRFTPARFAPAQDVEVTR